MKDKNTISRSESTANRSLQRYDYIDALRGIAIIAVLIAHTGLYSTIVYPSWFHNLTEISVGPRGVQLFYVVSAFTLCLSFSKRKNMEKHVVRNFYIRRFFRIAPLFYLAILYYLWQQNYWNHNPNDFSFLNIVTTFTFTNGISSNWINNIVFGGWSIAIESTFYMLFPFLFYIYRKVSLRLALLITLTVSIIMQLLRLYLLSLPFIRHTPDIQTYTFQFFPSQLPLFLIGMIVFLIMHENITSQIKRFTSLFLFVIGIVILEQTLSPFKLIAGHYIYGIFFGLLLYYLSKHPITLLVNPILVYLGKISFSLYLCHIACYYWLHYFGIDKYLPANPYINFTLRFFILLGFSSVVASVTFFTVETWGIILGKKIINKYEKITQSYITSTIRTW